MPKSHSPKYRAAVFNVTIEVVNSCIILPPTAESIGVVIVKLKQKLQYKTSHLLRISTPPFHFQVAAISENS